MKSEIESFRGNALQNALFGFNASVYASFNALRFENPSQQISRTKNY